MLRLVLTCGDDVRRVRLPERDAVLGLGGADIVAPYPGVSRRHARLVSGPTGKRAETARLRRSCSESPGTVQR